MPQDVRRVESGMHRASAASAACCADRPTSISITKNRERESAASRSVGRAVDHPFCEGSCDFADREVEWAARLHGPPPRCASREVAHCERSSMRGGRCVVPRASAAVAGAPAPTVSQASLSTTARSRTQAQLRHSRHAQLIGGGHSLDGRRRRRCGGVDRRLCLALRTLMSSACHHQLTHPVGTLVARARAAGTWRGAHARRLDRRARVLQHLVLAVAERGRLLAAGLNRRTAADAIQLRARIRRQTHRARLARATREQAQGTERADSAPCPARLRRIARRADAATGPHRNH